MSRLSIYLEQVQGENENKAREKLVKVLNDFVDEMYLIIGDEDEAAEFEEMFKKDVNQAIEFFKQNYCGPGKTSDANALSSILEILEMQDIDIQEYAEESSEQWIECQDISDIMSLIEKYPPRNKVIGADKNNRTLTIYDGFNKDWLAQKIKDRGTRVKCRIEDGKLVEVKAI